MRCRNIRRASLLRIFARRHDVRLLENNKNRYLSDVCLSSQMEYALRKIGPVFYSLLILFTIESETP